jgi:membrane protease YdiL (CAAX protease family)
MQVPGDARAAARHELAGAAFVFLTMLVASGLALFAVGAVDAEDPAIRVERGMVAQLLGSLAALGVACWWRSRAPLRGRGRAVAALGAYLAFLPVWMLCALLVSALWRALGWPVAPQPHLEYFADEHGVLAWSVVVTTVCLVGPVVEEVIFRGHLQTGLETLLGPRRALWLAALSFGLIHVPNGPVLFVPITALGLLFGWLRQRSGGLLAPIVAHAAHNTVMVLVVSRFPEVLDQLGKS